jgi:hypothetical protein
MDKSVSIDQEKETSQRRESQLQDQVWDMRSHA